jgi:hypothetical protein
MPRIGPIKRKDLIYYFRRLDFDGPYSGGNHQYMMRGNVTVRIPNPHQGDIGESLLLRILKQAHISKAEWEKL